MRRREFIALLGSAAALPIAAHGEQPATPVIGFLNGATAKGFAPNVSGFLQGLKEAGYVDGQNVAIEYRWAEGHYERLADMAADLVHRRVGVIAANTSAAPAAKAATTTIPIVFINGTGPVSEGLVKSMNRPGGNATGVSVVSDVLVAKQLDMLRELAPAATLIRPSFQSDQSNWASGIGLRPSGSAPTGNATPRPQCQQRSRDRRRVRFAGGDPSRCSGRDAGFISDHPAQPNRDSGGGPQNSNHFPGFGISSTLARWQVTAPAFPIPIV